VRIFAPAKINLFLHVGEKRADEFHELESLVAFADIGDTLELEHADGLFLSVEGPFAPDLTGDNLVLRAAQLFAEKAGQPVNARFTLTKNLPVASGIGGGSADAAAALRGLSEMYPKAVTPPQLLEVASALGSDVPACLYSKPLMMRGRGERIDLLPSFPQVHAVLVNPRVSVSTADVFRGLKTRTGAGNEKPDVSSDTKLARYLRTTRNDLEAPARAIAPAIGEVLNEISRMPGVELARMSGSGATCFGIFESGFEAEMAATALQSSHPTWWVAPTTLQGAAN
jgi:4-diphosphocytidyl-2-C-methyl-D-erythritol kinase